MPPKWRVLADEIAAKIHRGEKYFRPGDKLGKIEEVADEKSLSKSTVSQAYKALATEGLVSATPGQGTVVREWTSLSTGTEREERTRVTGSSWRVGEKSDSHMAGVVKAPADVADALKIKPGEDVLKRSRTYRDQESNSVVCHSTSWIPAVFAKEIPELAVGMRLTNGISIDQITRHTGRKIKRRHTSVEARDTTPEQAALLELPTGTRAPILVMTNRFVDTSGMTIEYGVDLGSPGRRWTKDEEEPS